MDVAKDLEKELGREFNKTLPKNPSDIGEYTSSLSNLQKSITNEDYDEFFEEITKEEPKEATGAGSAGGYETPLFGEVKKNTLFQPGTKTELTTKPKGGTVTEDKISGGLADDMTIEDLANHQNTDIETLIQQMEKGVSIEMEHTTDLSVAAEIAMDHIYEDLYYYDKLEDMESKKEEATEATTSSSVGAYDAPFGSPKKDPLKIEKSIDSVYKKLRSVKDPKFPKLGGPGSTYVKVKDKCKKFPYCNQGDIKALEFFENNLVAEAVNNISKKYSLHENYIKGVILENTNIYYKSTDMNKEIENMIDGIVDKVLSEEVAKKAKQITESVSEEIDEMAEFYEIAKKRREERMEVKNAKPDFLDLDGDGNKKESMKKAAKDKEETKEGAKPDFLDLDGDGDKEESMKKASKDKKETKESIQLSEEEMIDLIEKIIQEEKIEGIKTQDSAMKQSKKDTDTYMKDLMKKFKDYLKDGSEGKFEMEPKHFPKGNGELKKMEKMAYIPSPGVEEYIDQIARSGGMENLDYDQIKPNEEWLDNNILGSSETGNSDEYANAVATDVNKGVKKRKDDNVLAALKKQSYNKAPQPVTDFAGHHTNDEKFAGIEVNVAESKENKKEEKLNENLDRMKKLFSHNYKTQ